MALTWTLACPQASPETSEAPTVLRVEASVLSSQRLSPHPKREGRGRLQELHQLRALGGVLLVREDTRVLQLLDLLQALRGAARVRHRRRSLGRGLRRWALALRLLVLVVHEHLGHAHAHAQT